MDENPSGGQVLALRHRRSDHDITNTVLVSKWEPVWEAVHDHLAPVYPGAGLSVVKRAFVDFDRLFRGRRSWTLEAWRERYLARPLVAPLVRRLIWRVETGGDTYAGIGAAHIAKGETAQGITELEEFIRLSPPDQDTATEQKLIDALKQQG